MYAHFERKNTNFEEKNARITFTINEESNKSTSVKSSISSLSSDMSDGEIQSRLDPEQIKLFINRALTKNKLSWENLNFWDKARLFNKWEAVGMFGCSLTIAGSFLYLVSTDFKYSDAETLLGFGVFFIWCKTLSLFDNAHPYDLMPKTVITAFPTFIRVLAGILPYSIGTGFLAITLFWPSHDYFRGYA